MRRPSGDSADDEYGSEEVCRKAEGMIYRRGIEINIRMQILCLLHQTFNLVRHFKQMRFSNFFTQLLCHSLQYCRPRIHGFVYPVTETHYFFLASKCVSYVVVNRIYAAYVV